MSKAPAKSTGTTRKTPAKSTSASPRKTTAAKSTTTRSKAAKTTATKATPAKGSPVKASAPKATPKKATTSKATPKTTSRAAPKPDKGMQAVAGGSVPRGAAVPAAPAVTPSVVLETGPSASAPILRKKELFETVTTRSGLKKKDVKPVVEAMLSVLGDAVAEGRDLNLPPFAKLRIQKVKQASGARVTVARLRQTRGGADSED